MRKAELALIVIIFVSFAISAYLYPRLPDRIPSHWNIEGQVDGYMPKLMGALFLPVLMAIISALFVAIPKIDPKKKNIEKFRGYYDGFVILIILFLLFIHIQSLLWSIGITWSMLISLSLGIGILFFFAGVMLGKAKMNWFIGIRTPWTLSSEKVWDMTHKRASWLFKAAGIISILGVLAPKYAFWMMIVPVLVAVVYSMVYSYWEYRKLKKK